MRRFLITGRPGTGKSTIAKTMAKQGHNAYDLEEFAGIIRLEVKATGAPAEWPRGYVDWNHYAWNLQEKPLKKFLTTQKNKDVFGAVSSTNQVDFYPLFDKVFVLTLDNSEILRHRLETRNVHEYGQAPENIQRAVQQHQEKTARLLQAGGIPIDNSRPIDIVIQDIISKAYDC